jgi:hypothetical protein
MKYSSHRFARWFDFQDALSAGSGASRTPDERGHRFNLLLRSDEFKKSGLHDVASSLMENISRLRAHANLPIQVFNYGRKFHEVYHRIFQEHGRDPLGFPQFTDETATEDDLKFIAALEDELDKWMIGDAERDLAIGNITTHFHVAGIVTVDEETSLRSFDAFRSALVIHAWTVFESLAEDLWEAALNAHPTKLAALTGRPRSKLRSKGRENTTGTSVPVKQDDAGLWVSFDDLQRNSFSLRLRMGTILKERFSFRALDGIRFAYHRAFAAQSTTIDDTLDDAGLQHAAAVRNLLIHKRGIVDEEFIDQTAGLPSNPQVAIGEVLPLTGKLCEVLSDSCRVCAVWLVMAVHAWIIGHPEGDEVT